MRTTITLDDALAAGLRSYARANRVSLSKAAAQLIRFQLTPQAKFELVDGFPRFTAPPGTPKITAEQVKKLLDEEPW
ncbi:MAG: hypothetical protein ACRD01_13760 [Terriglobales bacterium]